MPIAQLQMLRKDVREFVENFQKLQIELAIQYAMKFAPEMMQIWPKVAVNNEKAMKRQATVADLWTVLSKDEMVIVAKSLRHVLNQITTHALKKNPLPANIRLEKVDAGGVPSEFQTAPGAAKDRVMLFFHGGGMVVGSIHDHRPLSVALGIATNMRVLSVDYRLAPENPFPASIEDGTAAYEWLLTQGFYPKNIIIAGDSAGGTITLATILNLRKKGIPFPRGAVCISPAVDYTNMPDSAYTNALTDPMLADVGLFWWIIAYLGVEKPTDPANPLVSPLLGDFHGFPPLLVQATSAEILFEGCQMLVQKALGAGVDVTLQTWDGLTHVWQLYALGILPEAQEAINKIGDWVRNLFA